MAQSSETVFPKTYDECPACHCKETVCQKAAEGEREKGRLSKDFNPVIMQQMTIIADPTQMQALIAPRRVPVVVGHFDICLKCGCLYCRRAELGEGEFTPQPPSVQPFMRRPLPGAGH